MVYIQNDQKIHLFFYILIFRWRPAALQPLQLALLFPFYEMGAWAFGGPYMTLSPKQFFSQVAADPMGVINEYWWIGWHGVAVWAVFGLVLVPLLWATFRFAFTKAASRLYRS
jgi:hypothetical protein